MDCADEWLLGDVNDPMSAGSRLSNPILFEDRMISDSVEYEHSYSNSQQTTGNSPVEVIVKAEKDLDDECYPAVPLSSATGQGVFVKKERTCPTLNVSPPTPLAFARVVHNVTSNMVSGRILCCTTAGSSEGQTTSASRNRLLATALSAPPLASLLKQATINTQVLPVGVTQVKVELPLPPTPPSSTSSSNESESDGSTSPLHPGTAGQQPQLVNALKRRVTVTSESYSSVGSTVSTQGTLLLTEEEKRTLIAEGYPVPQKLPLSKAEERSLKKIRRKIKNKISAQESRRKKKEYVDALERKVEQLSSDSRDMRRLCDSLEEANKVLRQQLKLLQQRTADKGTAIIVEAVGLDEEPMVEEGDSILGEEEVLPDAVGDIMVEEEIINISADDDGDSMIEATVCI